MLVMSLALAVAGAAAAQDGSVSAEVKTADGTSVGSVRFQEMRSGVLVTTDFSGLPQGPHGFHIHETGACTPDFEAAGEHLAPDGHDHGFAATEEPHAGDLPNITVAADGTAAAEFLNWRLNFEDLLDDDGSAIMIHAQADTYMDPDSAGERLACGVIEQRS
jgi:Cu-Zn family superoxide dismutase